MPLATWSRRKQAFWICVTLACGAILLFFPYLLSMWEWSHVGTSTDALTPADVQSIGQLQLPPDIHNLSAHYDSWMDFDLYVRFDIAPNQVDELLKGTLIRRPLSTTQIQADFVAQSAPVGWWVPGTPSRFEAGGSQDHFMHPMVATTMPLAVQATPPPATTQAAVDQQILIDESNPTRYRVWMIISNTEGH